MFHRIRHKEYRVAVGTRYGPTRIHQACYSPRHRRDGRADTTILYHLRIYLRTQPQPVSTTGLEHGQRRRSRRGRRTVHRTTGRPEQRTPLPNPPGPQDCPGTTGWLEQQTLLQLPHEGLRARRSSGWTKPEYTTARGRHDYATFRELANASV